MSISFPLHIHTNERVLKEIKNYNYKLYKKYENILRLVINHIYKINNRFELSLSTIDKKLRLSLFIDKDSTLNYILDLNSKTFNYSLFSVNISLIEYTFSLKEFFIHSKLLSEYKKI
jgi:hypothetical protein